MKKSGKVRMLVALLCAVVFVGACVWGAAHFSKVKDVSRSDSNGTSEVTNGTTNGATNGTTTTTSTVEMTEASETANDNYEDSLALTAEEFLTSLVDKDLERTLALMNVDLDEPNVPMKTYSFIKSVDVTGYEFLESQPIEGVFLVRLDITKSGSELFPVGSALWNLEVSQIDGYITLFKPADKLINFFYREDEYPPVSEAACFCKEFSECLDFLGTTDNFNTLVPDASDTVDFNEFCRSLAEFLTSENIIETISPVSRKALERAAKNTFGISDIDLTRCEVYQANGDFLYFGGRGGSWLDCSLSSEQYDPLSRQHTVVIDYYSDSAYILKAKTVQYVVKENFGGSLRLISTKLLYDTGLGVSGGCV